LSRRNAESFARNVHEGQKRIGGEDYITHPEAVAHAVSHLGHEYEAAAWLHDVMEDCGVSEADLRDFSDTIVECVKLLTHKNGDSYLTYVLNCKRHPIAKEVKIADLKHNLSTCPIGFKKKDVWLLALYILENTP
jgi:(p)ppGpp synthase/HD superfamily hydrolase